MGMQALRAPEWPLKWPAATHQAVVDDVVLGDDHLHAVTLILHRTSKGGHHIPHAADLSPSSTAAGKEPSEHAHACHAHSFLYQEQQVVCMYM